VLFRELRQAPPDVILIDLGRLPSQGRDVALSIRTAAATRRVPLVFIKGDPVKTAKVRSLLPDARVTTWRAVRGALRAAVAGSAAEQASPPPSPGAFAGYSGTPLPKKLGIKPGMSVALLGAPPGFGATVGILPEGAVLRSGTRKPADLVIWFVRSGNELARDIGRVAAFAGPAHTWIAWRKTTSGSSPAAADSPRERSVRAAGLAIGLVDFKICAIDETWSGLLFTRRTPREGAKALELHRPMLYNGVKGLHRE
jgi:hypothetical protein